MISVPLQIFFLADQIKKTEMGRACGTYGGEQRCL